MSKDLPSPEQPPLSQSVEPASAGDEVAREQAALLNSIETDVPPDSKSQEEAYRARLRDRLSGDDGFFRVGSFIGGALLSRLARRNRDESDVPRRSRWSRPLWGGLGRIRNRGRNRDEVIVGNGSHGEAIDRDGDGVPDEVAEVDRNRNGIDDRDEVVAGGAPVVYRRRSTDRDVTDGVGSAPIVTDTVNDDRVQHRSRRWWRNDSDRVDGREPRRPRSTRRKVGYVVLAVTGVVALRYGVDLGDEVSGWIGDRPDTGVDIWTWGNGDDNDGNQTGWDFNGSNETLAWNDDPVNENFKDTGGFDLFVPAIDGDWFSLNDGLNIDWPNNEGEPSVDFDKDGDIDAANATAETPAALLDAPEGVDPADANSENGPDDLDIPGVDVPDTDVNVDTPDVDTPDVDAPDVDVDVDEPDAGVAEPATPPPVWTPDTFTIEPGHGLIQEIHELGHQVAGYENFTAPDAQNLYESARERFGDNLLNLPNNPGNDLYRVGDDLRISAPGQAYWANQVIEDYMREEMEKLVSKT